MLSVNVCAPSLSLMVTVAELGDPNVAPPPGELIVTPKVSLGSLILGQGLPGWTIALGEIDANVPHTVGLATLWAAAVLTVITGWDYLRVGLKHMD